MCHQIVLNALSLVKSGVQKKETCHIKKLKKQLQMVLSPINQNVIAVEKQLGALITITMTTTTHICTWKRFVKDVIPPCTEDTIQKGLLTLIGSFGKQ